jgi:hypothetical protein
MYLKHNSCNTSNQFVYNTGIYKNQHFYDSRLFYSQQTSQIIHSQSGVGQRCDVLFVRCN